MPFLARAPREMVERKPAHGERCNRCGLCCAMTICKLGQHVFGLPERTGGACPGLLLDKVTKESSCGLAVGPNDEPHKEAALLLIGAKDDGCDCRINGEPINRRFHQHQARLDRERAAEIAEARRLWGMP